MKIKRLSSVLVPITSREIFQLETLFCLWRLWDITVAINSSNKLGRDLVISFDCEEREELKSKVFQLYISYQLDKKFNKLEVFFCNIPENENIYIRKNDPLPKKVPRLGYASGPNSQFFMLMKKLANREYILLNETDCVPYRKDWLEQLGQRVFWNEEFWILGSSYKGITRLSGDINSHINGNAVYATGSNSFQEFLKLWEKGLEETVPHRKYIAYDVYLSAKEFSCSTLQETGKKKLRELRLQKNKFVYSNLIWNASANEDIAINEGINDAEFFKAKSDICVCHGRTFIPQSFELVLKEIAKQCSLGNKKDIANLQDFIKRLSENKHIEIRNSVQKILSLFEHNSTVARVESTKNITTVANKLWRSKYAFSDSNLIFLLGNPRSGTTMMQKLIATSPSICTTGEPWIQLLLSGTTNSSLTNSLFDINLMKGALGAVEDENGLRSFTGTLKHEFSLKYYEGLREKISPKAKYFMDKTPRYSMICDGIVNRHPQAKYILITRNPFDIACSVITAWVKDVDDFLTRLPLRADFEVGLVNLSNLIKNPPKHFLHSSYELVTQNTDKELALIAEFLELDIAEFSLDYSKSTRRFKFGDDKQVDSLSKPMINKNSWRGALKNKDEYLKLINYLESLPSDVLAAMNYSVPKWVE